MPPILAFLGPLLASAGPAIAGGIGLGESVANLVSPPSAPTLPTAPASPASTLAPPGGPSIPQIAGSQQTAGAGLEARTGGGLSPGALDQLLTTLAQGGGQFGPNFGTGTQTGVNQVFGTPG